MNVTKQYVAVRAVIFDEENNEVLLIRESKNYVGGTNQGKYDFPGGKVELGETVDEAMNREVMEEAGINIRIVKIIGKSEWRPVVNGERLQIIGMFFMCKPLNKYVSLSKDHDDFKWLKPEDALKLPLISKVERILLQLVNK